MELFIVTGCTSGLGLALHDKLTQEKNDIHCVFLGRNINRMDQSPSHTYLEFDLSLATVPDISYELDNLKFLTITLISNAGTIDPIGSVANLNAKLFHKAVHINFISPALLTASLVSWSISQNMTLRIINISSGASLRPIKGWSSYCSTKASARMFFDVVALENDNVEVVHIDPGVMDTVMQKKIRKSSLLEMPDVDKFIHLKKENKLKSVIEVASSILKQLKVK